MPTRLILTLFFSSLLLLSLTTATTTDSDDLDEDLSFLDADDDTDTDTVASPHQPHDHDHADEFNEDDDEDFGNFDDFDESQFGDDSDSSEYAVPDVDEKDVVVLKERNFTDVIEGNKFVMVEFYAPWCGHCQSLAPEYAAAATQLKEDGVDDVVLAKVDATEENELAHQFDVQGFPTVYFFVDGEHKLYNGQRTKEAIVTWIKKKTGPSVHNITTTEEAEKILTSNEKVVLAYLNSLTGPESDELAAASRNEDDLSFYQTVKPNVAKLFEIDADAKRPALVLLKKDVEKFNHFDGKFEKSAISEFVFANKLPLVTTFTRESASVIFESQIKKQILLFATSNDSETVLPVFREAAKSFKGKLIFVYVQLDNEDTGKPVAEFFGVSGDEPKVIGYSGNDDGKKFFLDGEVTLDKLKAFAQGFVDDTLKPFYKSEPIPETNDGDVKIVVGNNFDEIVLDESKDVLLEIYAPWCGHCQSLEPIYDKLARHLRGIDSIVIAKMDGTTNEHPRAKSDGYPTILFFPAGNKSFDPVTVDTDRTVVAFYKFLKKHAAIPFKLSKPAAIPFKLSKPASTPKTEGSDPKDSSESGSTKELKDEL